MAERQWFEVWFDHPMYHVLYKHRDDSEARSFIDSLLNTLQLHRNARILDLACGAGRHSRYLNECGFQVIGLDLSANSIAQAKQFENEKLEFAVHDMREVYLENTFDLILNLFTSFGYFEDKSDNLRVLSSVSRMLKPNGVFVLDYMNSVRTLRNLIPQETKTFQGVEFHITRRIENEMIKKNIRFSDTGKDYDFTESVQAFSSLDFQRMLENTRMHLYQTFGDYTMAPFEERTSNRMILVSGKASKQTTASSYSL